ncbi:MAG: hypothetical protein WBD76_10615, partial [Methyloceanibacter sp.]
MTHSSSLLARSLPLAAVLALLAGPALAQDAPQGHPPVAATQSTDAPSSDAKPVEAKTADAAGPSLPPTSITHHT